MSQLGKFINAGSIGAIGTITGNVGGAVGPDGVANLNLIGSGPVVVTGNPGAFTLTVSVNSATTAAEGIIELATNAEVIAGADTTRAVVASSLVAKLGTMTANAIPYGAGTAAALSWTAAGTDGQLVIAATGAAPAFASLTSSGGFITFTPGANTLDLNTAGSVAVSFDGDVGTATPALGVLTLTGGNNVSTTAAGSVVTFDLTGTTQYAVQVGNATGSLTSLAVGPTNQVLKGNTGANPSWGQVDLTADVTGILPVANGGTGAATLTDHGILLGSGTSPITPLGVAGNGEIPIGSAGADPVLGNITATDETLTVTNGAGTIDIEAGTGLRITSGFESWSAGGPYYDDTTLGQFTVLVAGTGYILGEPVTWAGSQTETGLTAGNTYYIYMDNTGTIGKTTTFSEALFRDNVVLFEVMRDSTAVGNNQITVKENHPYQFPYSTSVWAHDTVGPVIADNQGGANITLNGTQKIEISGADELEDHGLETTIPDSGGVAETWEQYFTLGSGKWARYAQSDTFDGTYNNAGVATALGANKYSVYRLYVSKDDLNSVTPTYFAVLGDAQYNNLTAAQTAVANDSIPTASGELAQLELAQLGYIIFEESSTSIVDVIIAKETLRTSFAGATSTVASLILTDTTNFDHILSAADTTVQAALETIDDLTLAGDGGTAQAASAVFTVAGGTNITSAAAGSTVTLNLDASISGMTAVDFAAGGRIGTATGAGNTLLIQAYDVDGAAYSTFATLTANNTPTMDLDDAVTKASGYIYRAGGTDVPVTDGGTGASSLTDHGVLLGSGAAAISVTAVGATGTVLKGNTGADPTFGAVDLTTDVTGILPVANGGTGLSTITDHAIMIGSGAGAVTPLAVGATNQVLLGSTGADPTWGQVDLGTDVTGTLPVTNGGTGAATLTDGGILLGSGTGAITALAQPTDGQLPIGNTGSDPTMATITAGANISVVNGGGSITISSSATGVTWNEVTGTSQTASVNNGYICNNAALVTVTLPDTAALGSIVEVTGKGAGGWKIAQNAGETIYWDESNSTTTGAGGYLQSTDDYDSIKLICITADTDWGVLSSKGNITIV